MKRGSEIERETKSVHPREPLSQGDILAISSSQSPPKYGIIINADCDLENGNIDGVVSYLPIYSFKEYINMFWCQAFVDQEKTQLLHNILSALSESKTEISNLAALLTEKDTEDAAQSLKVTFSLTDKQALQTKKLIEQYNGIYKPNTHAINIFKNWCNFKGEPVDRAHKQMQAAYKNLGDGHFFLNDIDANDELGYVVRMRRIYSIPESRCYLSEANMRKSKQEHSEYCYRISRASTIIKFKISQLFANQFSRIGLPNVLKENHRVAVEVLAEQLMEE